MPGSHRQVGSSCSRASGFARSAHPGPGGTLASLILTSWTYDPGALSDADIAAYVHAYAQPGGLRGSFEDYRAWREDIAQDEEDKDVKLRCPTLALWGSEFEAAKMVDMAELWHGIAEDLTTAPIAWLDTSRTRSGQQRVTAALEAFLARGGADGRYHADLSTVIVLNERIGISALAALAGATIGGLTSVLASWLSQHAQAKAQWLAQDKLRRQETLQGIHRGGLEMQYPRAAARRAGHTGTGRAYVKVGRMRILSSPKVVGKVLRRSHEGSSIRIWYRTRPSLSFGR